MKKRVREEEPPLALETEAKRRKRSLSPSLPSIFFFLLLLSLFFFIFPFYFHDCCITPPQRQPVNTIKIIIKIKTAQNGFSTLVMATFRVLYLWKLILFCCYFFLFLGVFISRSGSSRYRSLTITFTDTCIIFTTLNTPFSRNATRTAIRLMLC